METTLKFGSDQKADLNMSSLSLSGTLPVGSNSLVRFGAGSVLDGDLQVQGQSNHTFDSGGLAFVGLDFRTGEADRWTPAIDISFTLGFSWGKTTDPGDQRADYMATDLRAGIRASWPVADWSFPYARWSYSGNMPAWAKRESERALDQIDRFQLISESAGLL